MILGGPQHRMRGRFAGGNDGDIPAERLIPETAEIFCIRRE
jgi:hypothetical protein